MCLTGVFYSVSMSLHRRWEPTEGEWVHPESSPYRRFGKSEQGLLYQCGKGIILFLEVEPISDLDNGGGHVTNLELVNAQHGGILGPLLSDVFHEIVGTLLKALEKDTGRFQLKVTVLLCGVDVEELMEPFPVFPPPIAVRHHG